MNHVIRVSANRQTSPIGTSVDDEVEILLVGDRRQPFVWSRRWLEKKGCRCHVAKSQRELKDLLNQQRFDIVLTMLRIEGRSTDWLGGALSGSRSSLFYMLPVEVGCWWVPVLRIGADCLGSPALRDGKFFEALDEIVADIRAAAANAF